MTEIKSEDVWAILSGNRGMRGIVEDVGSAVDLEQAIKDVEFTWIDDGKNEAKVTVEVRQDSP